MGPIERRGGAGVRNKVKAKVRVTPGTQKKEVTNRQVLTGRAKPPNSKVTDAEKITERSIEKYVQVSRMYFYLRYYN